MSKNNKPYVNTNNLPYVNLGYEAPKSSHYVNQQIIFTNKPYNYIDITES